MQISSLKQRDGHIKNNWYIACLSSELKENSTLARVIYDEKLVLFRSPNSPHSEVQCYPDRCPHRGTPLSYGKCTDKGLQCRYHGWTFDEGELKAVPSEGPDPLKGKRKIKSYPTQEKDGVIWVWMGNDKENEVPWDFPYAHDPQWHHYFMVCDFDNEVTHLAENFVDVPHTIWVHRGWFRNQSFQAVPAVVTTHKGRVSVNYQQESDSIGVWIKAFLNPGNEPMTHMDQFIYPNLTRVDYSFGERFKYVINSQITPVSTYKSRVYTYIAYKIPLIGAIIKPMLHMYTRQVLEQDVLIMAEQAKNLREEENPRFQSTPADEPHIQIERLRKLGVTNQEEVFAVEKEKEISFYI